MMELSPLKKQVVWERLIAIVEDQARALMKTAFSPIVRESGDLSAGVFDASGRMLAQARTGTPGHINTMAESVGKFLTFFPVDDLSDGDVLATNDPWIGTGHLNDYVVVTPIFADQNLIGFFACTGHMTDVGGIGLSPDGLDIFMEGTRIPPVKIVEQGKLNEVIVQIARQNSRLPDEIEGDIHALIACNAWGDRRLKEMFDEVGLSDLELIGEHIIEHTDKAFQEAIRPHAGSTSTHQMTIDGYDEKLDLVATVSIHKDYVEVKWDGTSSASKFGINVPLGYAAAYASYAVLCALAPNVPNNHGTLQNIRVSAPKDTIVNAVFPQPVSCRHIVGGLLPDVVLGAIDKIIPGKLPAESASALWTLTFKGGGSNPFTTSIVTNGGTGARPHRDGLSATAFPSAVRGTPVEMVETKTPLIFWRRELRVGSGGEGCHRGGLGQEIEIGTCDGNPLTLVAAFDRIDNAARGREGGQSGANGALCTSDGLPLAGKGTHTLPPDKTFVFRSPGGGGYGSPEKRDPKAKEEDQRLGLI